MTLIKVGWQNSAIDLGSKYGSQQSTHYHKTYCHLVYIEQLICT